MRIIADFVYASNLIDYYQKHSSNIFKNIISYFKRLQLLYRANKMNKIVVDKELLIEFIDIYNSTHDIINVDNVSPYVSNKVYTLKIESSDGKTVHVSTINDINNDIINIVIQLEKYNVQKIDCHNSINVDNDICKTINDILIDVLKEYLKKLIVKE